MGDRTDVKLVVPALCQSAVVQILRDADEEVFHGDFDRSIPGTELIEYYFDSVNYGELDFLDALQDAGIPFDSIWGNGDEYTSGKDSCRFDAADRPLRLSCYDDQINPDLEALMGILSMRTDRDTILNSLSLFIHNHARKVKPLSWDSQKEYIRMWATRRLIGVDNDV